MQPLNQEWLLRLNKRLIWLADSTQVSTEVGGNNMENKSNEELLNELENALIWMSIKTEQNKHDEVDRLQLKVDKLKTEILSRMQ